MSKHSQGIMDCMATCAQVILKPDPGWPQELYLGSLEALGIDTRAHDVRFVEDNWENPTLGAWGLGWEVWMDGERRTFPLAFPLTQRGCFLLGEMPLATLPYAYVLILSAWPSIHLTLLLWNPASLSRMYAQIRPGTKGTSLSSHQHCCSPEASSHHHQYRSH